MKMKVRYLILALFAQLLFAWTAGAQEQGAASAAPAETAPVTAPAQPATVQPESAPAPTPVAAAAPAPQVQAPAEPKVEKKDEPKWYDRLKFSGDFRFRHDLMKGDKVEMRNRERIRGRVGVSAGILDDLDAVLRIGTGMNGDPISENQTLTEAFSTKPVWLDLGYFDYHPSWAEGLHVAAGKVKNPWYKPGGSEIIWDNDVNPEGFVLGFDHAFDMVRPFLQGGAFVVNERKTEMDSWLLGAQLGVQLDFVKDVFYVLAGGGYYDYTATEGKATFYDDQKGFGNTTETVTDDTGAESLVYADDYNEAEGLLELGGKIAGFPWAVFGDYVHNVAVSDDNMGWLAGLSFGKCKQALDFELGYSYSRIQKDAVLAAFTGSDFGSGGTDVKGHKAWVNFQPAKYIVAGLTYFHVESPIDKYPQAVNRFLIDLNFKF